MSMSVIMILILILILRYGSQQTNKQTNKLVS